MSTVVYCVNGTDIAIYCLAELGCVPAYMVTFIYFIRYVQAYLYNIIHYYYYCATVSYTTLLLYIYIIHIYTQVTHCICVYVLYVVNLLVYHI